MNKTLRNFLCFILGIAIGLFIVSLLDRPSDEQLAQDQYCEMVKLNRADPTVGWPDFNESYDRECTNENAAR